VITRGASTTIAVEARGLPPARPGERYVVWLSSRRASYSAGTLQVTRTGWANTVLHSPRRAVPGSAIEISLTRPSNGRTEFRPLVQGNLPA
jgi:hypothetical protein